MTPDPFDSPMISQIITWIFSIPMIFGILAWAVGTLFEKFEGIPRIFTIWLLICFLLFSPARYIILQWFMVLAYPLQSISGFLSSFYLWIYIPIVLMLLWAIGLGTPILLIRRIAGIKEPLSKSRIFLAGIAAPVVFVFFSSIFYSSLPYAAYSTHWLGPEALIRTTNGPAYYIYRYAVEPFTPLQFPAFTNDIGLENMSTKERFRAHVAAIYCGNWQYGYYVSKAYPDYYQKLQEENGQQ